MSRRAHSQRTAALTLVIGLAASGPAWGQLAAVSGSLVNHDSRSPVEGARVSIVGTELVTSTDAEGRFRVSGVQPGVRVLQVRAVGYVVGSWVVELGEGQRLDQTFELVPRVAEVAGVDVTAPAAESWRSEQAFEERRHTTTGFFLTRQDIRQRNAPNVTELLRTVPGLLTTCGKTGCALRMLRGPRPCTPEYFLDGYPATIATGPSFPLVQIRGVEVYREYFEVPAEFQRPNLQCGVIAIWTVEPGTPLERH